MDETGAAAKLPHDIIEICAMNAVLHTEGVAEMAAVPGIGRDRDAAKGIKAASDREGLDVDVYLNVAYGAKIPQTAWNIQENVKKRLEDMTGERVSKVNIHIMGVSRAGAPGKGHRSGYEEI